MTVRFGESALCVGAQTHTRSQGSLSAEQTLMERRYVTGTELHRANMDPEALLARLPLGKDARVLDNARACLRDISELNRFSEALSKTTIKYDWDNPAHEKLLDEFWQLLRPGVARAGGRGAAEWEQLGFTCHEPSQDLRGFGLLALTNMVTFARRHTDKARRILEETHKLPNHFSYAPACVNTTHYLYQQTLNHKIGLVYYKRGGSGSPEFFQKLFGESDLVFPSIFAVL
jgi:hypothetical protein